jgi:hypothetical protein
MSQGPIFKPSGFARLATITKVDASTMSVYVTFRPDSPLGNDGANQVLAQLPISYLSSGGGFIGGYPAEGTPVYVTQVEGTSSYVIVAFASRDPVAKLTKSATQINIPDLVKGEIVIQANTDGGIILDDDSIIIGEPKNSAVFDTTRKIYINTFDQSYYLGQGSREINGIILRDKRPADNYPSFLREYDPAYDDTLITIGMDPIANAKIFNSGTAVRNPARIEKRETIYEYEESANVYSNDIELEFYKTGVFPNNFTITDRRAGRADALSLSLTSPNYLMESIKGTVVDIYGNVIDLNRDIIPLGKDNLSSFKIKSTANEQDTFKNAYEQIKRQERKSLAFHFEINSRKETKGSGPPNVNNKDNYARARSRFFFDVDKEGQFKLNVPASSETGNIPLNTRYENYSTISPNSKSNNTNDIVFNNLYKDILAESFINESSVSLTDDFGNSFGPIDRFSDKNSPTYIKHGTVYHNIGQTCSTLQSNTFYTPVEYVTTTTLASGGVIPISEIVSPKVITIGANANAGGRSGSLNFDGSIEINIGANTIDRQSLWLDTQGGMIANIGRDLRNISLVANMDGEVIIQVGGNTVPAETERFKNSNTGWIAGVVDIRVFNSQKEMTILRIDDDGMTVTTPGSITYYARKMLFRSSASIEFDSENLILNGRKVIKDPGAGPIR